MVGLLTNVAAVAAAAAATTTTVFHTRYNQDAYLSRTSRQYRQYERHETQRQRRIVKDKKQIDIFPDPIGCTLYIAESSIPDSGWGVYSGITLSEGDIVTSYDLPIQMTDLPAHNTNNGNDDDDDGSGTTESGKFRFLLDDYFWEPRFTSGHFEGVKVQTALPSFGMAVNGHTALSNLETASSTTDDESHDASRVVLNRFEHAGAGAVSNYRLVSWMANATIPRGGELFLNYGDTYFIREEKKYGMKPLRENYEEADGIVRKFREASRLLATNDSLQELWEAVRDFVADERTRTALPSFASDLDDVEQRGGTAYSSLDADRGRSSSNWLDDHGRCMDNLKAGVSTLSAAGRGAFATRYMTKGSTIAPVPLVQMRRRNLNIYEWDRTSRPGEKTTDRVVGQQLLLNYCFGHVNSSLLLFPYSVGVTFVNHGGGEKANAAIRWSNATGFQYDWLQLPVNLIPLERSGLMFDIVATKDILPEDEIFIDYGRDWENAWNRHVQEWEPPLASSSTDNHAQEYQYSNLFNRDHAHTPIRTKAEEEHNPYPTNLQTACFYRRGYDSVVRRPYVSVKWFYDGPFESKTLQPCTILKRYDVGTVTMYTARIHNHDAQYDNYIPDDEEHVVFDIPRRAIRFVDVKYTTDMFLEGAFRHVIGIPNDVFPDAWKDLL